MGEDIRTAGSVMGQRGGSPACRDLAWGPGRALRKDLTPHLESMLLQGRRAMSCTTLPGHTEEGFLQIDIHFP